jgi:RimJ/RimL family protein N-acetyltransferase
MILIAQDGLGTNIGQVRFDRVSPDTAEIDISIDPARRGVGYAAPLLVAAMERFFGRVSCGTLMAIVKESNAASLRAFERAGFERVGLVHRQGCSAVQLSKTRA